MTKYRQHTFFYRDDNDYIRQLDMEIQRICGYRLEKYTSVRDRYGLSVGAFCMRLRRFLHSKGQFPHTLGKKGRRIIALAITPALDWWLRKPGPRK